jgi:O-antigen/teichoic acid export membrane protein
MNLQEKTTKGVRYTFAATVLSGLTQAAVLVVLARLLTPADYGLVAGALVIVTPIQNLAFMGLERAMVLQTAISPVTQKLMNYITIGLALITVFALLIVLEVLPLGSTFRLIAMSLAPLIILSAIGLTARTRLRREMEFGKLALADTIAQIVGFGALSILAALSGFGAWSLVFGYVAQAALHTSLCIALLGRKAPPQQDGSGPIKKIFLAAYRLSTISVLEMIYAQIPSFFVGAYFGAYALGQFSRGYALINLPVQLLVNSMSRVLFTSFVVVRDEQEKLRNGCRLLVEIAAAITLPLCFGMAAAASEVVAVLLGPQWDEAESMIPWLAVGTAAAMMAHLFAVMNEAVGRLREKFVIQAVTMIASVLAFWLATHVSLHACAASYAFGGMIFLFGQLMLSARVLKNDLLTIIIWLMPGTLCALALTAYIFGIRMLFLNSLPLQILLGLEIFGCGAILALLYGVFFPRLLREIVLLAGLGNWVKRWQGKQ